MKYHRHFRILAAALLWSLLTITPARAQQVWQVTLDTSPLAGQSGNLDLQFNPGGLDTLAATVAIGNVTTDGSLASTATLIGGATGALPGPPAPAITNTTAYNDLLQGITFGQQISFDATFTGPALTPTAPLPTTGSIFAVSLYDPTGTTPLLTTSPDGSIVEINLNPDGSTSASLFPDSGGTYRGSATLLSPTSSVPEGATLHQLSIMLILGGLGASGLRPRRLRQ